MYKVYVPICEECAHNYVKSYCSKCLSMYPPWSGHTPWGVQAWHWEPLVFQSTHRVLTRHLEPLHDGNLAFLKQHTHVAPLTPNYRPSSLLLGSSSWSPLLSLPSPPLLDIPFINMSLKSNTELPMDLNSRLLIQGPFAEGQAPVSSALHVIYCLKLSQQPRQTRPWPKVTKPAVAKVGLLNPDTFNHYITSFLNLDVMFLVVWPNRASAFLKKSPHPTVGHLSYGLLKSVVFKSSCPWESLEKSW